MDFKKQDITRAMEHIRSKLPPDTKPVRNGTAEEHIAYMLIKLPGFQSRPRKMNRWLGFIQGWLWATGRAGIDEMRAVNSNGND